MKKLLMLGTSKASCEMIEYAKSQGIYTIVTDYFEPEKSKAKLIADEYWMISTGDFDALEKSVEKNILMEYAAALVLFVFLPQWNCVKDWDFKPIAHRNPGITL